MKDIWKDPSVYDGMTDGPPYLPLPGSGIAKLAADASNPADHLALLVVWHKALAFIHQAHHWQTRGSNYYGDHLLFMRIYEGIVPLVDQLAERAVGLGGPEKVAVGTQLSLLNQLIEHLYLDVSADVSPDMMPGLSLKAEEQLLEFMRASYDMLDKAGTLTMGVDDLLQAIASKHEEFVYLLKQRVGGEQNDPWKL